MPIGSNIRKIREQKNISVDEIVKKLRIFKSAYEKIEKNIQMPNDKLLIKIANALNINRDDIINYNEDKSKSEQRKLDLKNLKYKDTLNRESDMSSFKIGKDTFIPIKKPKLKEIVYQKPQLLNKEDIFKYGNNINLVGVNNISPDLTVSDIEDPLSGLSINDNKTASPKILNWVEPFKYKGTFKTLFYTEVNTGLKVGDRVFIINGNYDSDLLIQKYKYASKTDGYKVLYIENCKIVLDIDYTGQLPYEDYDVDQFINVYKINDETDFIYFNKQVTTRGGTFSYKFNGLQNNLVYSENNYTGFNNWGENAGINSAPGFFIKDNNNEWINVTDNFTSGSLSLILNNNYSNKNSIRIHNGSFDYEINSEIISFKEDFTYKWDESISNWKVDVTYSQPLISKSNFRDGNFKGEFNSGIYGTINKKIKWEGNSAIWNTGTLLNVDWIDGVMNSIYALSDSYISRFDDGKPYEKLNAPNNNGWGINYVFYSNLNNITIENANIFNSEIGYNKTYSAVYDYLIGTVSDYSFEINKSYLENNYLKSGNVKESDVVNSRSDNTKFDNIKSINSTYKSSTIKNSKYLSEDNIKIINYQELSLNIDSSITSGASHKVYRFYISKPDFYKLKIKDNFYIKGLIIKDKDKYPLNFFNKKFKLSSWTEYIDFYSGDVDETNNFYKREIDMAAFITTPAEKEWLYNTYIEDDMSIKTISIEENTSIGYSIDLFVSLYENENYISGSGSNRILSEISSFGLLLDNDTKESNSSDLSLTNKIRNAIDISNAYIVNADFESGIIEATDWISGNHINYNNDLNITEFSNIGGKYDITYNETNSYLEINTLAKSNKFEMIYDDLKSGSIVFLNNVYYNPGSGSTIKLGDTYEVVNDDFKTSKKIILKEIITDTISSITNDGGYFNSSGLNNRWGYIHRTKINSSKIKSGIFRRSYLTNCLIENTEYNAQDKNFDNILNIKGLIISDSIFKDNGNILSKATYIHSSISGGDDEFVNGIVFRSIWKDLEFKNGVFKESSWISGTFSSGTFYKNSSFNSSPNDNYPYYDMDRIKSYYKSGETDSNIGNNRFSWKDGIFNGGEFIKSDWEYGILNDGEFYYSNFYNGTINGGLIGNSNIRTEDTIIYNANINYTIVQNALLYAEDPNLDGLSQSNIIWQDGIFKDGVFGSNINQGAENSAIWYNGIFSGGEFANMAKWKNGIFNGGKFTSGYGWDMSDSLNMEDYSWEKGTFNGGVFGNELTGTNSTWYSGTFNDGTFVGRVWNSGDFKYGRFIGSATISAIGGMSASYNASIFVDSFEDEYYGHWRNGSVGDEKYKLNEKEYKSKNLNNKIVLFENCLWENGEFNHPSGSFKNSIWLDGTFKRGKFIDSSFNPFVKRNGETFSSFNLEDTCFWENGNLENSDFYISKWKYGIFDKGNGYGMIWKDGICNYMNAYNVFWEKGIWKNGNWNGSYIDYNGGVENELQKQLLLRGIEWSNTQLFHLWNIFEEPTGGGSLFASEDASPFSGLVGGPFSLQMFNNAFKFYYE